MVPTSRSTAPARAMISGMREMAPPISINSPRETGTSWSQRQRIQHQQHRRSIVVDHGGRLRVDLAQQARDVFGQALAALPGGKVRSPAWLVPRRVPLPRPQRPPAVAVAASPEDWCAMRSAGHVEHGALRGSGEPAYSSTSAAASRIVPACVGNLPQWAARQAANSARSAAIGRHPAEPGKQRIGGPAYAAMPSSEGSGLAELGIVTPC